jgi:membrane protein
MALFSKDDALPKPLRFIAAVAGLLLLGGVEINAEMEHQTARDTTEDGEKPMGARGARMADEVGAAQVG